MDVTGHSQIKEKIQELLKELIIVPTISPYNNPICPFKKTDYRNLNKHCPKIEGALPDTGTTINNITTGSRTYYTVKDLPDMFFAIPVDEESQTMIAFTWEGRQYKFTRSPQGYLSRLVTAHNILTQTSRLFMKILTYTQTSISFIDDTPISGDNLEEKLASKIELIKFFTLRGWTINPSKVQRPHTIVGFLDIISSSDGRKIQTKS